MHSFYALQSIDAYAILWLAFSSVGVIADYYLSLIYMISVLVAYYSVTYD